MRSGPRWDALDNKRALFGALGELVQFGLVTCAPRFATAYFRDLSERCTGVLHLVDFRRGVERARAREREW